MSKTIFKNLFRLNYTVPLPRKEPMPANERAMLRLREFRLKTGFSQAQFAAFVGLRYVAYAGFQDARTQLNYHAARKILSIFWQLNPIWLADGIGEMLESRDFEFPSTEECGAGQRSLFSGVFEPRCARDSSKRGCPVFVIRASRRDGSHSMQRRKAFYTTKSASANCFRRGWPTCLIQKSPNSWMNSFCGVPKFTRIIRVTETSALLSKGKPKRRSFIQTASAISLKMHPFKKPSESVKLHGRETIDARFSGAAQKGVGRARQKNRAGKIAGRPAGKRFTMAVRRTRAGRRIHAQAASLGRAAKSVKHKKPWRRLQRGQSKDPKWRSTLYENHKSSPP